MKIINETSKGECCTFAALQNFDWFFYNNHLCQKSNDYNYLCYPEFERRTIGSNDVVYLVDITQIRFKIIQSGYVEKG